MFTNISMAGTGQLTLFIVLLLQLIGIDVAEETITQIVLGVGALFTVWGQIRRSDLVLGLIRKY